MRKFRKTSKSVFVMVLALVMMLSTITTWADKTAKESIPENMKPGTIIKYNNDKKMVVIQEGDDSNLSNEAKLYAKEVTKYFEKIDPATLPEVEAGMIVIYDALGSPIVIHQLEESMQVKIKEINLEQTESTLLTAGSQSGDISWYDGEGKVGAAEVVLTTSSAAHMTLPFYTLVSVKRTATQRTTTAFVLDRGNFPPNVILDLVKSGFERLAPTSMGWFTGTITWY